MSNSKVRVRFAPSPTGFPHVGNIRTALFNWLFARHSGGSFIVRIEDTDVARTVPGALEGILDGLRWLNLDWNEGPEVGGNYGPYIQSQRLQYYHEAAERLVAQGNAYYCFCSPERLKEMRAEQSEKRLPPGYDRKCRNLSKDECARLMAEGNKPVIRFKTPLSGESRFHDIIRGELVFDNATIDDFVMLKSDGYPTYHLANVVDDHMMEISHVLRAEEWLSSVPRHKLMYDALGFEMPLMVHLPMILGTDRSKLSKRHGSVSITDYRDQGYLPETMVNFLALLGWSLDGKTEVISRDELVENFSLERVSRTGAIFDKNKLEWMNGIYIRKLPPEEFFKVSRPFLTTAKDAADSLKPDEDYVKKILPLVQERVKLLSELPELTKFFYESELEYDAGSLIGKKMGKEQTLKALTVSKEKLEQIASFDADPLEAVFRPLAQELGLKTGQLFGALRTATTGRVAAPPLFDTMTVLGRDRCLKRINEAIEKLKKLGG
ncbi:MAG: glutamate--tRNA ligase [Chloroflexota bacterium]